MKQVIIASNNAHKVQEIETALDFEGWEFKTLRQARMPIRSWVTLASRRVLPTSCLVQLFLLMTLAWKWMPSMGRRASILRAMRASMATMPRTTPSF